MNGLLPINPAQALPTGIGFFDFHDIHFAANTFVATGASGQVFTSVLAANVWTQHDILSFSDLRGITFNNAQFIAVGTSGEIWSSTNGVIWNQQISGLESTVLNINGVTALGTGFIAVGDDGHILTSLDGATWAIPYPQHISPATLRDVNHSNGIYTAVGDVELSGKAIILNSLDGSTWTKIIDSPAVNNLQGIAFGNGQLVVVGDSGFDQTGDPASRPEILTSSDNGATWTKQTVTTTPATFLNLNGVAFGGNLFVAVGDYDFETASSVILTSPDGISWTRQTNPSPDILRRITYVNGTFVVVGGAGTVLVSTDGVTWLNRSISFGPEFTGVAVKPGVPATLAAVGTNSYQIYRSADDGTTWTIASHAPASLPTSVLRGIYYADGQFVAVAESDFIFSSTDAITWSTRMGADIFPGGTRELYSVTFGNGKFLAVGANGAIMQSTADSVAAALPVVSVSPSSLVLAPAEIGTTVDTVFTITNRGGAILNVVDVAAAVNPAFAIQANTCSTVAPGATCNFTVRYTPALPSGTVTSTTFTITSDDLSSPMTAALKGTSTDTVAPDTTITANPAAIVSATSATFSFSSTDVTASFECKLDTAAFATCTSPATFSGLTNGSHTFQVRALDAISNVDATPAAYTWTVDTFAPDTTITVSPAPITNLTTATFNFTSSEPSSTFECSTDAAVFAVCTSPVTLTGLSAASHTLEVRATDVAGNTDVTPASFTWVVDATAPDTTISTNPAAVTNLTTASFSFSSSELSSTFECSLDAAAFAACTTPANLSALTDGSHTFQVRATDVAGNPDATPASFTWMVDLAAPDTTITVNPAAVTNLTSAAFSFTSADVTATFECSTDAAVFAACTSPLNLTGLIAGSHTFQVRATEVAGNTDATPAIFTWTVDLTAPETTVTVNPAAITNLTTASFSFSSSEPTSTFECSADAAAFAACTSPVNLSGLIDGSHTFQVRATDVAGNLDATPASFTWMVDLIAPDTTITVNPAAVTNLTSAEFSFTSTDGAATFECSLDAAAFATCTSPRTYSGLTSGTHFLQVRAKDTVGNFDATPAINLWSIDLAGPTIAISAGSNIFTTSNSVIISGTVEAGAQVTVTVNTSATVGPVSISGVGGTAWNSTISNMSLGSINTITVTAIDAVGNQTVRTANVIFDSTFVKRTSDALTGSFIQPLYNTSAVSDTLQLRSGSILESPVFDRTGVSINLNGGFDTAFASAAGVTVINGKMTVRQGKVRVNKVKIQ